MIRIRFHGRGGQGVKTASRIVGTAAFLDGYSAQDSPIYGAERRGAPVVAFTRLAQEPILERGLIAKPDLVVVADETLLDEPTARVLEGVTEATAIFVNTTHSPEQLRAHQSSARGHFTTLDLTGLVLARIGKAGALSAPLAAVAARLLGLNATHLRAAVAQELSELGISPSVVEQNQALAADCYAAVSIVPVSQAAFEHARPASLWTPIYDPPTRGTARVAAGANTPLRKTGDWRVFRPVLVPEKCNGCWLCFVYCPDAAISLTDAGRPIIDYEHCKGCLLCVQECPAEALVSVRESEAGAR